MVKSANIEDHEEADNYDAFAARNDSYTGEMAKMKRRSGEQKANTCRSKHSETEQRRRSKINERFQTLMDLIPQSDQKRDKASFLLEVIQYIQYLQEKLRLYEGTNQGWSQGPTKLTPWSNNQRVAENAINNSTCLKNWPAHENSAVPQGLSSHTINSLESDISQVAACKPLDHIPVSSNLPVALHMKTDANILASMGQDDIPPQILAQSASDIVDRVSDPHDLWQVRPSERGSAALNEVNELEYPMAESGPGNLSTLYSQGVANALTLAFQTSGVDMSQTKISVDLNVVRGANGERTVGPSASKADENLSSKSQNLNGEQRYYVESDQAHKRRR